MLTLATMIRLVGPRFLLPCPNSPAHRILTLPSNRLLRPTCHLYRPRARQRPYMRLPASEPRVDQTRLRYESDVVLLSALDALKP